MTVEVNDIIRLTLEYLYPGAGTALNILHYALFGSAQDDQDVIDTLVDWVTNEWAPDWANLAATNAELASAKMEIVGSTGLKIRDLGTEPINIFGSQAAEVLPAANSVYIQAYTGTPGVRGSKYIPGIAESVSGNGVLTAGALADVVFLLATYVGTINISAGNNLFPGVVSSKLGGFTRLLTLGTITTLPGYQRRRKEGVGS